MSNPAVYAHRGASGYRFENTMAAFKKAVQLGADGIELDLQLSEDGIPFVIHDLDLYRVAGIRATVPQLPSGELRKIRVGRKWRRIFFGSRIPTFVDVVLFCQNHDVALNVELKETFLENPESIQSILAILTVLNNVHISSFHYELLEKVKTIDDTVETALLVRKKGVDWDDLVTYQAADGFHFHKRLMKEPFLAKLVETNKTIRIYGVTGKEKFVQNPPPYIKGWITDYPDCLLTKNDHH